MPSLEVPARFIEDAFNVCEPEQPLRDADDPRYYDLSVARGDQSLSKLRRRFELKTARSPEPYLKLAFVSHRGAGKTTELLRLGQTLAPRYRWFYFEANTQLDPLHLEVEDLLLALVLAIEEEARTVWGKPLSRDLLARVEAWFQEQLRTTSWQETLSGEVGGAVEAKGEVPFLASVRANLKALLQSESKYRTEIRDAFRRTPRGLVDAVNDVLNAANEVLKAQRQELVVVIDNLDRYPERVVDGLLIQRVNQLEMLRCHLVVTPPVSMYYRPVSTSLESHYDVEVMQTVRLRGRDEPYTTLSGSGPEALLAALGKRMVLDELIPDPAARDALVRGSGGAIRELLSLVREAILNTPKGTTIPAAAVHKALQKLRRTFRDRINANGWAPTLARISRDKQIHDGPAVQDVLFHRLAFSYNGDGWYDVHPLVTELDEFVAARRTLDDAPA